ncbi:diguanylate cyclase [Roseivivax sediminis]|uniref:diguanylate cyclase n=1 Tax=Roseivivax sediminis TaxID=936889 RepID=A0A1I1THS9_9RHOB|nr:diguanylate cyclase [Roseivivax sediminis]SFD55943.1 response regulator receiver modulated diguanylate cyclase [Roseivivax sediminis]
MTGRILVVDGTATHRIILRVKLGSAFYDVAQAASGTAALEEALRTRPDLVLAANRLEDMTGAELCRRLRPLSPSRDLPVILIQSSDDPAGRLEALRAGAEDTLARPLDEVLLFARLRSLLRAREAERELRLRDDTGRALGLAEDASAFVPRARVALVEAPGADRGAIATGLRDLANADLASCTRKDVLQGRAAATDLFVLVEGPGGAALDLLSEVRSRPDTRRAAILYIAAEGQRREAATALDLGADDLVIGAALPEELTLRTEKLMQRKRVTDRLRASMQEGLRAALTDPMTGLYNRRYALPHLERIDAAAQRSGKPYGVLMLDIDRFKTINDGYGHAVGDLVLTDIARRLQHNLRAADLLARHGGEEFLVILPDTDADQTLNIANRLCARVREVPVKIGAGLPPLPVTISAGATVGPAASGLETGALIAAADHALYAAKEAGRDRAVGTRVMPHLSPKRAISASSRSA